MVIKVVALNDDNHDTCFATVDTVYYDARRFMEACLLNPHNNKYIIRGIYICDPPAPFDQMNEDEFIQMFELVEQKPANILGAGRAELLVERTEVFNKFWECGTEDWF